MSYSKWTVLAILSASLFLQSGCSSSQPPPVASKVPTNKANDPAAIRELMKSASTPASEEGIAAAILLDTSGSMADPIQTAAKGETPKIQVAQKALLNVLRQFSDFARKHPDKKIRVGIYDFSTRKGQPSCRKVVPLGPPDVKSAEAAINHMMPAGSTPIGDAMIAVQRDLNATGLNHRHMLVITDGENNVGYLPGDVARVITQEPESARAAIYFIAFDVGAELFEPVRDAGGLVLAADSEKQLTDTLDFILTGKILVEEPTPPPASPHPVFRKK